MNRSCVLMGGLFLALAATGLEARDIVLKDQGRARPTGVRQVELNPGVMPSPDAGFRVGLEVSVGRLTASDLNVEGQAFTYLAIPGYQHTGAIGSPSLPVMNRLVEVPLGGEVQVKVLAKSRERVQLADVGVMAPLFPRQPPQPKDGTVVPFELDSRSYKARGFQQDELASVEEVGLLRDTRLVLLKVAPVAYDPVDGVLEVSNDLTLELSVKDADLAATAALKNRLSSPYFSPFRKQAVIPPALQGLEPAQAGARTYAVVADPALVGALQPLLDWKTEQGFRVHLATTDTVGTDPSAIREHVHGLYTAPADGYGAPDFLLIVGDHDNVPSVKVGSQYSGHLTDLTYVTVTDDDLPDILYGRLSARTADELAPQVAKIVEYERFTMPDPSFLEHVVLTAGWDYSHAVEWGWPQIKYGIENYFNAEHGIPNVSSFLSNGSHQNESEILEAVGAGASFVNYTAHGSKVSWADPKFTIADVEALENTGKYPLVLANCCITSAFQVGKCFGESWLRAPEGGAIGYIGGSNNTYWDEDLWFGVGFYSIEHPNDDGAAPAKDETDEGAYDAQFGHPHSTAGSLYVTGNLAVQQSNTSRKRYYWEVYHLFGDPSLQVYWGVPGDNAVSHPEQLRLTADAFEVRAEPGSYVGLSAGGRLVAAGFAGADGAARLPIEAAPSGESLKLVVTAKGKKPYTAQVAVAR